jgi:hypothetical protein
MQTKTDRDRETEIGRQRQRETEKEADRQRQTRVDVRSTDAAVRKAAAGESAEGKAGGDLPLLTYYVM